VTPWPVVLLADLLVIGGLVVLTLALAGIWRFDDLYARLHAVAKVGSLGLAGLLLGSLATGDWPLVARAGLVGLFLVLTAPVSSHVIARAAHRSAEDREGNGEEPEVRSRAESGRSRP
jgi:multicomponent Na+:H+ antiporter subunit G